MAIHPTAIIDEGAKLGSDVQIGPYCHVGAQVVLGDNVILESHVVIAGDTIIGADTHIYPFASIGHIPQDLKFSNEPVRLEIGARNRIREYVAINPGTAGGGGLTRIGDDNLFMVGTHVAHDCMFGNQIVLSPNALIGGHVVVDDKVIIGGAVAIHQNCRIGVHAFVGGGSIVAEDVIPFGTVTGNRAVLSGLNLVGLRRHDFERTEIKNLQQAHKILFLSQDGTLADRLASIAEKYKDSDAVQKIVAFMQAEKNRGFCMPIAKN